MRRLVFLSFLLSLSCGGEREKQREDHSGFRMYARGKLNIKVEWEHSPRSPLDNSTVERVLNEEIDCKGHCPNIYFLFFDTLRWDIVSQHAPHIMEFIKENTGGKQIACAPGTYHSSYAFMNSQPCQFLPEIVQRKKTDSEPGAIWLRVLKKLGYKIHAVGEYWNCVKEGDSDSWSKNLEQFFGHGSHLIEQCSQRQDLSPLIKAKSDQGLYSDDLVIDLAKNLIKTQTGRNIHFLYLYSSHDTYKWNRNLSTVDNSIEYVSYSDLKTKDPDYIRTGYVNAVKSLDHEFFRFISYLKSIGKYDSSMIVLTGDHGEMLGEKRDNAGANALVGSNGMMFHHGRNLWSQLLETVVAYHFPKDICDLKPNLCTNKLPLYSHLDIVPSVLEGIGLGAYGKELFWGTSLLSLKEKFRSVVSVEPEFWNASHYMTLTGEKSKLYVRIDFSDFADYLKQKSFTVLDITNLEDQSIHEQGDYKKFGIGIDGVVRDQEGLVKYIRENFREAMNSF